jgi:phosphate transport system substrate-binding protein
VTPPRNPPGTRRGLVVLVLGLSSLAAASPAFAGTSLNVTANPATAGVSTGSTGSSSTSTSEAGPPATDGTSTTVPGSSSSASSTSSPTTDVPPISSADPLLSTTTIIGSGSSFAGPEVLQWTADTAKAPYNLTVNYDSTSSGDGRYNFGNNTIDYAVSDIPYQGSAFDTKQPTFPFIYVPVTAGGLAFMYHLSGLSKTLQLSSYSACAIFTGAVQMWNDPIIQADNPGLTLPAIPVRPVIRTDLAGTNFVFQEYCIHSQPAMWKAFVTSPAVTQNPSQVGDLSATDPRSDWPLFPNAIEQSGSAAAADTVAVPQNNGYITAVETAYAIQRNFPVASVKNASGVYNQPGSVNVASALAYATQNANGTHNLNFDGTGPHVYNPSTYSYLLTPTSPHSPGWDQSKGYTMSQFANYALTIGQQKATEIGYASLGLSLEQYGVNAIKSQVTGAVAPTAAEQQAYACGDLTVPEVQAGQTQPTCGVLNNNNSTTPGQSANGGGSSTTTGTGASTTSPSSRTSSTGKGAAGSGAGSGGSGSGGSGTGSGGSSVDPGVSLSASPALPTTGGAPLPVIVTGVGLATLGWFARRRLRTRIDARR